MTFAASGADRSNPSYGITGTPASGVVTFHGAAMGHSATVGSSPPASESIAS